MGGGNDGLAGRLLFGCIGFLMGWGGLEQIQYFMRHSTPTAAKAGASHGAMLQPMQTARSQQLETLATLRTLKRAIGSPGSDASQKMDHIRAALSGSGPATVRPCVL